MSENTAYLNHKEANRKNDIMDTYQLTDVIEAVFEEYVKDLHDLNDIDSQDLSENIALRVRAVLGLREPVSPPKPKPSQKVARATATVVSTDLGKYRDDEDGKPLARAMVRQTRFGPVEYGGFKVKAMGTNNIEVRWIAPDDMNDQKSIDEERVVMLTWYSDILGRAGYKVDNTTGYSLAVSR